MTKHHFVTEAWPQEIPSKLLGLDPEELVSYEWDFAGWSGSCEGYAARDYISDIEGQMARQSNDLFTVCEAAQILADHRPDVAGEDWVGELRKAQSAGGLAIRHRLSRIPFRPANPSLPDSIPNTWTAEQVFVRNASDLVRGVDLDKWLRETTGEGFPTTPTSTTPRPVQRQRAQEEAILAKLVELGYTPTALPKPPPGKHSRPKQEVKASLRYTDDIMKKAWQRLRHEKLIRDA